MEKDIRSFLFDLGGVIVDIDGDRTIKTFEALFKPDVLSVLDVFGGEPLSGGYISQHINDYQIGKISTEQLINFIKDFCKADVTSEIIIDAWMQMLLGIQDDVIQTLRRINDKGLKIYILSNINELHVDWLKKNAPILNIAAEHFYSNEIHLAKPDKACYEYVLSHSDIDPQHTLYLDDLIPNIEAGKTFGFQTFLVSGRSWINQVNHLLDEL